MGFGQNVSMPQFSYHTSLSQRTGPAILFDLSIGSHGFFSVALHSQVSKLLL